LIKALVIFLTVFHVLYAEQNFIVGSKIKYLGPYTLSAPLHTQCWKHNQSLKTKGSRTRSRSKPYDQHRNEIIIYWWQDGNSEANISKFSVQFKINKTHYECQNIADLSKKQKQITFKVRYIL